MRLDSQPRNAQTAGRVAATVGDEVITIHELKRAVQDRLKSVPAGQQPSAQDLTMVAEATLQELIERSVIVQDASVPSRFFVRGTHIYREQGTFTVNTTVSSTGSTSTTVINGVPADDHVGQTFGDVLGGHIPEDVAEEIARVFETGEPLLGLAGVDLRERDACPDRRIFGIELRRLLELLQGPLRFAVSHVGVAEQG